LLGVTPRELLFTKPGDDVTGATSLVRGSSGLER
jgi:hypothetical protein